MTTSLTRAPLDQSDEAPSSRQQRPTDSRAFQLLMLVVCLALVAGPSTLAPMPNLDASWRLGLNLARLQGMQYGKDIVFTYGPWGFLDSPVALSRANIVLGVFLTLFSATVAWWVLRRTFMQFLTPAWAAAGAAAVVVLVEPIGSGSGMLFFACVIIALQYVGTMGPPDPRIWLPAFLGASAGFLLLVKFSEGVFLAVIAGAAAIWGPSRPLRRLAESAVAFCVAVIVLWLLAGQSLGDLWNWLRVSIEIARGYTEAMASQDPPYVLGYLLIGAVFVALVVYWVMYRADAGVRRSTGVAVIVATSCYLGFREGTGRFDSGHELYFYLWALPALAWFIVFGRSRVFRSAVLVIVVVLASNGAPFSFQDPYLTARADLANTIELTVNGTYQRSFIKTARENAQQAYQVSDGIRATVGTRPIAVDGTEVAAAWAYEMTWSPAPIFQSYSAYTAKLDGINSDWLRESSPDQMFLRPAGGQGIDHRNFLWDSPEYVVTEMCMTSVIATDPRWMLLAKSENRCGDSRALSATQVSAGEKVDVPRVSDGQMLVMSFDEDSPGPLVALGRTLNKSYSPLKAACGDTGYRLPRALAEQSLVVSVPGSVGWPAEFGGSTSCGTVSFSDAGRISFSVIDVKPRAG